MPPKKDNSPDERTLFGRYQYSGSVFRRLNPFAGQRLISFHGGMRLVLVLFLWLLPGLLAGTFTAATYNLEFYVDKPAFNGVKPKTAESRRVIRESLRGLNADVVALQEMGSTNALLELRAELAREGLDYPHWDYVRGRDSTLHLAFLSKHPITARRHHASEGYLHQGRRFYVARGFGEIEVTVAKSFRVTLITAHLKSQRIVAEGDQQAMREEEALLLREKVDAFFKKQPKGNLVVLGDLNDRIDSQTLRTILGRGKSGLWDTRPTEGEREEQAPRPGYRTRDIVWTHFYGREDSFSRIDYILVSPALKSAWLPNQTRIYRHPDWGTGSDHRPLIAGFEY